MPRAKQTATAADSRRTKAYTHEERVAVLALLKLNKGNMAQTARESGIAIGTLRKWVAAQDAATEKAVDNRRKDMVTILEDHIYKSLDALDGKRDEASYAALINGINVMVDKWRLLQGLPTQIVEIMPQLVSASKHAQIDLVVFLTTALERFKQISAPTPQLSAENATTPLTEPANGIVEGEYAEITDANTDEPLEKHNEYGADDDS